MRKILFYGDSNTYGYDPADFFGGPYASEKIWTSILAEHIKDSWEVISRGENGRRIPDAAGGYVYPAKLLLMLQEEDVFAVMLGDNDLLVTTAPDAEVPIRKMEAFLSWLVKQPHHPKIFLIAPPAVGSGESTDAYIRLFHKESIRMNNGYAALADRYQILFADASKWGIPLAFDEIHFSEEGHKRFAECLIRKMESEGMI